MNIKEKFRSSADKDLFLNWLRLNGNFRLHLKV
jgi:hypothetical protein